MDFTIKPGFGIGNLLFGMKLKEVTALLGLNYIEQKDADANLILTYNHLQMHLTFYADEDFRFGYLVSNHSQLNYLGKTLLGESINEIKEVFKNKIVWEKNLEEDTFITHHFNETLWIDLHEEFLKITKIELGVPVKNLDEFDWKFPIN